nr:unnamed protein product [Digitaria exilis]
MSSDSFRKPGAVLMNTISSPYSSVSTSSATASAAPLSCPTSLASSPSVPLLDMDSPFAGAERHRISSSAFGGGAVSCSNGSWPPSSTMSHLENTLAAAALPPAPPPCSSASPLTSSDSVVESTTAPWRDDPKQSALWRRLRSAPPRKGSASRLMPRVSSHPTFFLRPCIRSISSTTVIQLLAPSSPRFFVAASEPGFAFLGRPPTLIWPTHVTLGDRGSSSSSSALCFALEPRNIGLLPRGFPPPAAELAPGSWSWRRRAAAALSMVVRDGLQMGLGISASPSAPCLPSHHHHHHILQPPPPSSWLRSAPEASGGSTSAGEEVDGD